MRKIRKKFYWVMVLLLLFPIMLNFVLQIPISDRIIGDETTWLHFWATYLGAMFSALMVYISFKTISKTVDINVSQKRSEWLCSFRSEAANLLSLVDTNYINVLAQEALWGQSVKVMEEGFRLENSFKKSTFILNALLLEYDSLFDESKGRNYIQQIEHYIYLFYAPFREFVQFSVISDYLSNGNLNEHSIAQVLAMKRDMDDDGFKAITKAIDDLSRLNIYASDYEKKVEIIKKRTLAEIMKNLRAWDSSALQGVILSVCEDEAKEIHSMSLFNRILDLKVS